MQKHVQGLKIFVDADDTILESSKAVIELLNERYNIQPPKTFQDLKEWNYKSIYPKLTDDDVRDIYDSEEFFVRVKPNPIFEKIFNKHKEAVSFVVVTKGTFANLDKKKKLVQNLFPSIEYIGLGFEEYDDNGEKHAFDKSCVDMSGGIQIDDRVSCLNTNASVKILIKNGISVPWNHHKSENVGTLYVADTFEQVEEILDWLIANKELIPWDTH